MFGDFIIYDTENTDLKSTFGQITQFGGIKLSHDFSVKSELALDIRLLRWIVPGPGACRVTKVGPAELSRIDRMPEFNAANEIFKFLRPGFNKPVTYITFNGISHDDKFLRTMFFRNLLNPWFTSGNHVACVDMLPLMQLIHAVDPSIIKFPTNEDGKVSFKLDRIAPENGINVKAHDALGDSYACRDLIQIIRDRAPWAWQTALANGKKSHFKSTVDAAINAVEPMWIFTHFGEPEFVPVFPVAMIGRDQYLVVDLRRDDYQQVFQENKEKLLFKGSCFHQLSAKKFPTFVSRSVVDRAGVEFNERELLDRCRALNDAAEFRNEIKPYASGPNYVAPTDEQSEERLVPFMTKQAEAEMKKFVDASDWSERLRVRFSDQRARDFAARIILDAHLHGDADIPAKLVDQVVSICEPIIQRPYGSEDCRWTTLSHAMAESPDQAWLDWAIDHYGDDPRLNVTSDDAASLPAEEHRGTSVQPQVKDVQQPQMSFGF